VLLLPSWVAGITSRTRITIPRNLIVFIGKITGVIVFMAFYTTKKREISGSGMTIRAFIPFSIVFAAENGEIQLVVLGKVGGIPARIGRVADLAVGRKIARFVVRAGGGLKI